MSDVDGDEPAVLTREIEGVLVVILNRPRVLNAVDGFIARGIEAALDELERRPDLRVAVLTGAGRAFCAGMNLKVFGRGAEFSPMTERGFGGLAGHPSTKPTIAAVEGYAFGGGFEIALACDLIVAGQSAQFALPEVKRGLVAGGGGILRLPRKLPRPLATEMMLTGDPRTAGELDGYGLLATVVPDGTALDAALDLAGRIAANSPVAVDVTKRILDESVDWDDEDFFDLQQPLMRIATKSADAKEGATAFLEKRAPVWPSLRGD